MATKLEKNITRESSIKIDGREILITLTSDQKINLKLKGLKNKGYEIGLLELWDKLSGSSNGNMINIKKNTIRVNKDNPVISLYDLRSHNAIFDLNYDIKSKIDLIIKQMIENLK